MGKKGEAGMTGGLDTHGRPRSGGAPAPAPAYSAPSSSGEYAGFTPDQIEFMKRKKGEVGMTGGLDTHGRPRSGGHAAPAPAPAYSAPSSSSEYAGMTQDQIDFMRRKKGEIGMTGGLDTHGRPRLLIAQESSDSLRILAVGLLGFFTCSGVIFALVQRNLISSEMFRQPLLTA